MNILTLDIETRPNLAYVWGLWEQNIPITMLEESVEVVCFAAKWLGSKNTMFFKGDVAGAAWELLNQADVVIHYNGKKFDIPHLNTLFLAAGLGPPSPFKQIDLCNVVKSRFNFPSNKLQYVATALGLPGKADTGGFELWRGVMRNDPKAWKTMEKYNKQDVVLTEQVYDALIPWIPNHPSAQLYDGVGPSCCPTCGGGQLQKRGYAYTKVTKFQQYQCMLCGSYFRDTSRIMGVSTTESVL